MGLRDRAVDSLCESEVVRIDNEPPHGESLAGKRDTTALMLYDDVDSFAGFKRPRAVSSAG